MANTYCQPPQVQAHKSMCAHKHCTHLQTHTHACHTPRQNPHIFTERNASLWFFFFFLQSRLLVSREVKQLARSHTAKDKPDLRLSHRVPLCLPPIDTLLRTFLGIDVICSPGSLTHPVGLGSKFSILYLLVVI